MRESRPVSDVHVAPKKPPRKKKQQEHKNHYLSPNLTEHTMRLKYILVLLATLLVAPAWAQEAEEIDLVRVEIDSLFSATTPDSPDSVKAKNYKRIAYLFNNVDSSLKYAFLALDFCNNSDSLIISRCNRYIALAYFMKKKPREALTYAIKSINLSQDNTNLIYTYVLLSKIYEDLNNFDSTNYYIKSALEINIKNKDTANISYCYRVLGSIFFNKNLLKEAEQYYRDALVLDSIIRDTVEIIEDYFLLGECYTTNNEKIENLYIAKKHFTKASDLLNLLSTTDKHFLTAKYETYGTLAEVYIHIANLTGNDKYADSCLYYIDDALAHFIKQGGTDNIIKYGYVYADYLKYYKIYDEALTFMLRQKKYLNETTSSLSLRTYYSKLKEFYLAIGDYKNAYDCLKEEFANTLSHINDSSMNALAEVKTDQAMMLEKIDREKTEAIHAAEKQKMRVAIFSLIGGMALVLIVIVLVFRVSVIRKRANNELAEQKEEIETQRDEIEFQRDHIEQQNKEIQASITYARRIQRALLTPDEAIASVFPDYFLLYKPRSVVSGDFYWVGQFGDNKVCIVADCTGHGVPGGFMSVLGMTNLNYIVGQEITPEAILNKLRDAIMWNLRQKEASPEELTAQVLDGMDVAAYVVNERQMTLSFAGANNPLVLIRDGEVQVIKPDKMPVGISVVMKPFQSVTMELRKGDCLYTYSDGFQDQFNIESEKKFQKSRLRDLLLEIHQRPMNEQRELLNLVFKEWRGPAENQTDDVVIMGVRI